MGSVIKHCAVFMPPWSLPGTALKKQLDFDGSEFRALGSGSFFFLRGERTLRATGAAMPSQCQRRGSGAKVSDVVSWPFSPRSVKER